MSRSETAGAPRTANESRTTRRVAPALLLAGVVVAAWRSPAVSEARFVVSPAMAPSERLPLRDAVQCRLLPQSVEAPSVHACSLSMAPDGDLLLAHFEGSREGAADVSIRMRRFPTGWFGGWRQDGADRPDDGAVPCTAESWTSLTRDQLQKLTSRSIRKLGNPVLWQDAAGRLHLSVVSVSLGGWSGGAINTITSEDGGHTWADAKRLVLTPFLNLGSLVRTPPLVLQDGSIGLPAYHEFVQKWGMWVRMTPQGSLLEVSPMRRHEGGQLQPAVVALTPTDAVAALRSAGRTRKVGWSATEDAGATWPLRPTASTLDIPNPDSSVAMIRLQDGSLLLACNPLESGRNRLQLFRSADGGTSWKPARMIAASDRADDEFSYPALVQARDGLIHLGFTCRRTAIALCTFSPEWLDGDDDGTGVLPSDATPEAAKP